MSTKAQIKDWDSLPVVLDLKTVSLIFDVSELTVRRWLSKDIIIGIKLGNKWLFDKNYIRALVNKNSAAPRSD